MAGPIMGLDPNQLQGFGQDAQGLARAIMGGAGNGSNFLQSAAQYLPAFAQKYGGYFHPQGVQGQAAPWARQGGMPYSQPPGFGSPPQQPMPSGQMPMGATSGGYRIPNAPMPGAPPQGAFGGGGDDGASIAAPHPMPQQQMPMQTPQPAPSGGQAPQSLFGFGGASAGARAGGY